MMFALYCLIPVVVCFLMYRRVLHWRGRSELFQKLYEGNAHRRAVDKVSSFLAYGYEDELYDYVKDWPDGSADELWERVEKFATKPALKILCDELGHDPVQDHCGKPEHDYCTRCQERTPGKARRATA